MSNPGMIIELDSFQGPFDLLLHLIKQMEIDINDIPMTEITQQYLSYIDAMKELELDIIGDYLVMAASLIEIKSRLLLPIEPESELESDYEDQDPREGLIQQLLLYQQFQTVATQLERKQEERSVLYTRPLADLSEYQDFVPLEPGSIKTEDLVNSFINALEKFRARQPLSREIEVETLSVSDQMNKILTCFESVSNRRIIFQDLIDFGTVNEIVTTFLAMLELVKKQEIMFVQLSRDDDIEMKRIRESVLVNEFN